MMFSPSHGGFFACIGEILPQALASDNQIRLIEFIEKIDDGASHGQMPAGTMGHAQIGR
jgi:hypothetical protein